MLLPETSHGFLSMTRRQNAKVPNGKPLPHLAPKRPGSASRKWNACWLSFLTVKEWFIHSLYFLVTLWIPHFTWQCLKDCENESPASARQSPIRGSSTITMHRATTPSLSWTTWLNTVFQRFLSHPTAQMSLPQTSSFSPDSKGSKRTAPRLGPGHSRDRDEGVKFHFGFCVRGGLPWKQSRWQRCVDAEGSYFEYY